MTASSVFVSHSTQDKKFATRLRDALRNHGVNAWIDHRELTAGGDLNAEIKTAIQAASVFVLVLSVDAQNSDWVAKETDWALEQGEAIQIVPLLLGQVKSAAARRFLGGQNLKCIEVKQDDLQAAMPAVLAALGLRLPDHDPLPVLVAVPVEELILHLRQATIEEKEGKRRSQAEAMLEYRAAGVGGATKKSGWYIFNAPLGPIEAEELSWYLERFPRWPGEAFRARAEAVEKKLPVWGQEMYQASLDNREAIAVRTAWEQAGGNPQRRITIWIDDGLPKKRPTGQGNESAKKRMEAEAHLLSLPWELLHNGDGFLFDGNISVRVRRGLPTSNKQSTPVTEPPLRVLLLSPRPEDKRTVYIDHRTTARPVAEALAALGDLASLTILDEPTLPALIEELKQAAKKGKPYHVVHFDGHGIYLKDQGLGALIFEADGQREKLVDRETHVVNSAELTQRLIGFRFSLFFLDACQTAQVEMDSASSVATALLDRGVAAVAAMSHSVLVATAKAFVTVFYKELANGARVGEAMLAGQCQLFNHKHRGHYLGAGDLELHDWFVPVLYQEEGEDPALVKNVPSRAGQELIEKGYIARLGELPDSPPHQFVGRSRELLALERLLLTQPYGVLLGEGGEGKTALAVEAARWLVCIRRVQRVAFVSLEQTTHQNAVLDAIGRQLVGQNHTPATLDLEKACLEVECALLADATLLVLDNMETVLPPQAGGQPAACDKEELAALLALFRRFQKVGETKLLFTSRERLPALFDAKRNHLDIGPLAPWDAVEMVKNVLLQENVTLLVEETVDEEAMLLDLVHSVRCNARTLALLAPKLARRDVVQTTADLHQLMADMEKKHPGERERSLYAGVALSLNRLSPAVRQAIRPLGVFRGGGHLEVIRRVLEVEDLQKLLPLVAELVETGLCDFHENGYLTFHFALAPFLWGALSEPERQAAQDRWLEGEEVFAGFLYQQKFQDAQLSATLTLLDLNNLLAGLEMAADQWPAERVLDWASDMAGVLQNLGKNSARQQVTAIRKRLVDNLGKGWSPVHFNAAQDHIEDLAQKGDWGAALAAAQTLLQQCRVVGEDAYPGAAYGLSMAHRLAGLHAQMVGHAAQAIPWLQEALTRFQRLGVENQNARRMAAAVLNDLGDCWFDQGKLEEAAHCYDQSAQEQEQEGNQRGVAVSKIQLGTVRMVQRRYPEALAAYQWAREMFTRLNEPSSLATVWHQTGMVYERMQAWVPAEEGYRESLRIRTALGDKSGVAATLTQLGNLFQAQGRWEAAVAHYRKAAELHVRLKDQANEGKDRNNLADTLVELGRLGEAREEILRAIECLEPFGHAATPWTTYQILATIETAEGHPDAAAEAGLQARTLFAQYRRDGGENHNPGAKWCQAVAAALQQGAGQSMREALEQKAQNPKLQPYLRSLIPVLLAILSGHREPSLADTPGLDWDDAVEVALLLAQLGGGGG